MTCRKERTQGTDDRSYPPWYLHNVATLNTERQPETALGNRMSISSAKKGVEVFAKDCFAVQEVMNGDLVDCVEGDRGSVDEKSLQVMGGITKGGGL